jgi:serine/threonine-protein kinase RsbW
VENMGYNAPMKDRVSRRTPWRTKVQKLVLSLKNVIPSDLSLVDGAVAEITAAIDRTACWEDSESIGLAVREALTNAIVHGNQSNPARTVRVSVAVNNNCELFIVVKDSGSGFDPTRIADPTAAENILASRGRGIFLMKHFMDEVEFKFGHGTEVYMRKRRRRLE